MSLSGKYQLLALENPLLDISAVGYVQKSTPLLAVTLQDNACQIN